jgi:hypothetical protein
MVRVISCFTEPDDDWIIYKKFCSKRGATKLFVAIPSPPSLALNNIPAVSATSTPTVPSELANPKLVAIFSPPKEEQPPAYTKLNPEILNLEFPAISEGTFSTIYKGTYQSSTVAVKEVKNSQEFSKELDILK